MAILIGPYCSVKDVRAMFEKAFGACDMVITTGGVSMGEKVGNYSTVSACRIHC